MDISDEMIAALRSYIIGVETAVVKTPEMPIEYLSMCGCMGPLPECACQKRKRLIDQFLAETTP